MEIVISSNGLIPDDTIRSVENLKLPEKVLEEGQKAVLLDTANIVTKGFPLTASAGSLLRTPATRRHKYVRMSHVSVTQAPKAGAGADKSARFWKAGSRDRPQATTWTAHL
ncbi:unnamed protein product [Nezara viridula]|uniref:Uncharacterized protein n=1 Tax=Nezara viridula TaxID=85310 RepID=A0A9P0MSV9_NEZVI|nr:unnamed protein product [Nezara viridula]